MKWVTRERPKTDRIACPWLIRKFIDPDAEFLYVPADQVLDAAEREGAHSFDAPGARYTHRDGLCSFEVLVEEYDLSDPAVHLLARIVHGADVAEDRDATRQSPGPTSRRRRLPLHLHRRPCTARRGAGRLRRPLRLVPTPGRRQLTSHHAPSPDATRIIRVQALRAVAYGAGSVLIGVSLDNADISGLAVGLILASLLFGSAIASLILGRYGDRIGRRRCYLALLIVMALAGTAFALTTWPPLLILAALTGTVSPDVVESGPFTSLEQAMLPHTTIGRPTRLFGRYNTVATLAGSLGAALVAVLALADGNDRRLLLDLPAARIGGAADRRRPLRRRRAGHRARPP